MILIFDLDDTIYPEINYVLSGFKHVANFLEINNSINSKNAFKFMINDLKVNGRGKIFDNLLKEYDLYSKSFLIKCINIYRNHDPDISLESSTEAILRSFNKKIYLVTDGHKIVQKKKVNALKINSYFKKIFITHRYGKINAKPSTYCFNLIRKMEKCKWNELIYIGDNPLKDFVNLNIKGALTIRVMQGMFSKLNLTDGFAANYEISDLNCLIPLLKKNKYI